LAGKRLAVTRIRREWRQPERIGFDVILENDEHLILYYYPGQDTWVGVRHE